jgi:hypothetical protein
MLQAGRLSAQLVMSLDFSSSQTVALGSTQPLTEICIRNIHRDKQQLVYEVDNFAAICEVTVYKM